MVPYGVRPSADTEMIFLSQKFKEWMAACIDSSPPMPHIYVYVVGEVFPWGGNSVIFSICASISRTGGQLHEVNIWLDPRSLDEFYGALMLPKVNIIVT